MQSRKKRDTYLRGRFGIGLVQYEKISSSQDDVCFICHKKSDRNEWLCVDHDHNTNAIRGLLCESCNLSLGRLGDSIENLKRAVEYLGRTELDLGADIPIEPKQHNDKPRWRCIVNTPDGSFNSYEDAGKFYKVHSTTIRDWCLIKKREGFTMNKVFKAKNDA